MNSVSPNINIEFEEIQIGASRDLKISLTFTYFPYDFRNYKFDSGSDERLNWLYAIGYNYVPFTILKSSSPGGYTSLDATLFSELDLNLSTFDDFRHKFDVSSRRVFDDIIEKHLKENAVDWFSANLEWFNTMPGQQFDFNYAFNGSLFFSKNTPINGFNELMSNVKNSEVLQLEYKNWDTEVNVNSYNEIQFEQIINLNTQKGDYTYAVVAVNPRAQELHQAFYTAGEVAEHVEKWNLRLGQASYCDTDNKTIASTSIGSNTVTIDVSSIDTSPSWKSVMPTMRLNVEKYFG